MKKNFKNSSTTHASTIYLFLLSSIAKSFLDLGTDYRNTILRPRTSSLMVLTTILWKNNKLNNGLCPCVPHVSTSISSYITRKFSHSSFMFLLKHQKTILSIRFYVHAWHDSNSSFQIILVIVVSSLFPSISRRVQSIV
jgi:hypothetical protein